MNDFCRALTAGTRLIFDGAMGTMLQQRGLAPGESPETFCLAHPEILEGIHVDYARAGADILTTNTFGGTRYKLPSGIGVGEFNRRMARAAQRAAQAAGGRTFVAGSIGPTGKFLRPLGDLSFDELVDAFEEQIRGLAEGGVDLVLAETQFDIAEARAAVVAARRVGSLPVGVSMTYEQGVTLTGSSVAVCAATLANLGVDFIGMNCSAGPVELLDAATQLLACAPLPVCIQPNAGLPVLEGENTVFPLQPGEFADLTSRFAAMGAQLVGGCCGTTPEHIAALSRAAAGLGTPAARPETPGVALTSRSTLVRMGAGRPFALIGERINPTGKKKLAAELQAGEYGEAFRFADEQSAAGAPVLDVNVGAPMVDETTLLPDLTARLASRCNAPLCLDSSNSAAIAAALKEYPASALVNSISGETGRMETLGPVCRDFGAPFILLPLRGSSLPVRAGERIAILEGLLEQMDALGIPRRLAMVDALVLAASSSPEAGAECLEFIRYCAGQLGLPVTCGLSNISFGLPARELLNGTFLALAAGAGLNSCIANPSSRRVREAVDSLRLLLGHDVGAEAFVRDYAGWPPGAAGASDAGTPSRTPAAGPATIEEAVIAGDREAIQPLIRQALEQGEEPYDLVDRRMIPAITEVGARYERREYFLPQLIRSAETMQKGFALLRPLLEAASRDEARPVIVMATVEGDIHDIGKNIVSLMLGNHGFQVIDLGKDVPARKIVDAAERHGAALVGLSALMTTTMVRMGETVALLRERGLSQSVMVGGAVVTEAFARSIGAHYSDDAVDAVRVAKALLEARP